ncbi:GAF domain-containing protein [Pseudanabaena mucicola]|uniref:GAF domain-containing protein n=1 Tax=Pseudanabaena mucicola FACHB-723 TaxID=2692860 RepID=A0ABR7ZTT5_9CYAN|nr:GAF domain-containing protein [Pseudanabaena mucicola]MBD2187399.1 GAF domain-containing protein [Pseudanabaena mucicola FACHB-723]
MNEIPSSLYSNHKLEHELIALAMLSCQSPEELLKIFLTSLGSRLNASRIVIYQMLNTQKGHILVEAISPDVQSIKDRIYSIHYLGINSVTNVGCDRTFICPDVTQIDADVSIHQQWQETQVKAMMSAPIRLDLLSHNNIWGWALVQSHHPKQWELEESHLLFDLAQVLGQCLQNWELKLQFPHLYDANQQNLQQTIEKAEFWAKRTELIEEGNSVDPLEKNFYSEEITLASNFLIVDDQENLSLDRMHYKKSDNPLDHAVNIAMEKLEQKIIEQSFPLSPYSFANRNKPYRSEVFKYEIDLESQTLEDILENKSQYNVQSQYQGESQHESQRKIEYLQQKVSELVEGLQQKLHEISILQYQVQQISEAQQEIRQLLNGLLIPKSP